MSSLSEEECRTIRKLISLTIPMKGGQTGYTAFDVIHAMSILSRGAGRPMLSRALGLGEASVKTMLKRMRDSGLITRAGRVNVLTKEGVELLSKISYRVSVHGPLRGFGWVRDGFVVIIRGVNPPVNMVDVIRVRDYIVARGCREVIVGGLYDGKVHVPGAPDEVSRDLEGAIASYISGVERAILYVVPRECLKKGFQAALDMLLDNC